MFKSLGDDYIINTPRFGIFKEQAPLTEAQNDENTGELTKNQGIKIIVKSRAVDRSTIQFLTILGVLLTKTSYHLSGATIAMSSNQSKGCMNSFQSL